jgi:nitrite reductase (NO-forming)
VTIGQDDDQGLRAQAPHRINTRARVGAIGLIGLVALAFACAPSVLTPVEPGAAPARLSAAATQPAAAPVAAQAPAAESKPATASQLAADLRIAASEFVFDQPTLQVEPGQKVHLSLDNRGAIQHNLHVQGSNVALEANPGQVVQGDFTFDKAGTYEFFCSIPGHKDAGMKGKLIVGNAQAAHADHAASSEPVSQPAAAAQPLPEGLTRLPQPQVAPPVDRREPALVKVDLETREVTALLDDGVAYRFWTFNGSVPGPMIRVRQGDTVELTLKNAPGTQLTHSINLHAVNGPGGGSVDTQVVPGDSSTIRFQTLHPGVYVYHCMTPMVGQHVANGMYGMIVVEPPDGLPKVDREFYIMQGDFYLQGDRGQKGQREFSLDKLFQEDPEYVVYNGSVGSMTGERALHANVGETVRFFFGVGGPNKDSAFHVVGESFDVLHPEGSNEWLTDVQTTLVPPGGATMAEMKLSVPGHYMVEDHHITRLQKGAMADFQVDGEQNPDVFEHLAAARPTGQP